MAELPSDFWTGWIATLTVVSLAGLGWLIYSVYFAADTQSEEDSPVWDGELREGAHPAPLWWFWLIFVSLVISVLYLMLYPGLGSHAGALRWSQGGELERSIEAFDSEFATARRLVAEANIEELSQDRALMASAQRVYDRHCAVCHGYDSKGLTPYFPDLTDDAWQWGGSAEQIEQSIRQGRHAVMVGWRQVVGEDGVDQLTDYTLALSRGAAQSHPPGDPGRTAWLQFCAACHGPDGTGNPLLGAPNLTDGVYLYGGDIDAIRHSIAVGRNGQMPAFGERLDDTQIRLLVALLTTLSDRSRQGPPTSDTLPDLRSDGADHAT